MIVSYLTSLNCCFDSSLSMFIFVFPYHLSFEFQAWLNSVYVVISSLNSIALLPVSVSVLNKNGRHITAVLKHHSTAIRYDVIYDTLIKGIITCSTVHYYGHLQCKYHNIDLISNIESALLNEDTCNVGLPFWQI